ncbi:HVO_A0556 family zinc finger protein [Natrialbaceae archaeon AArc-T1-2]|uniref:HVO_A0556 family zinc finger protein n=1 Tax=Natrialbaceae archaeon AArc-T1-2 TaxID=3053904 RepID=UPI00255B0AA6|nr:HVO_A0556 family zinc finger protein [Natrialbaceae archaeon AArc-T1-2]WIV66816.1 hypothetical protein QQ977_14140 [Natrialbaceae archaeon AArc-T1-2]
MARPWSSQSPQQQLLATLEGRNCPRCTAGKLVRSTYKGNEAVVCDSCNTPQAQVWDTA